MIAYVLAHLIGLLFLAGLLWAFGVLLYVFVGGAIQEHRDKKEDRA